MNNHSLQKLIGSKVLELDFVRRHPLLGWSDIRGMFGTTNPTLLNSDFGFQVLHFQPPKGVGMGYDYKAKNLCVIWDIFRQEYRVFGAEQVNIHKQWNLDTEEDIQIFHNYIYNEIMKMSKADKLKFMGYIGQAAATVQQTQKEQPPVAQSWTKALANKWNAFTDRIKNFFTKKKK